MSLNSQDQGMGVTHYAVERTGASPDGNTLPVHRGQVSAQRRPLNKALSPLLRTRKEKRVINQPLITISGIRTNTQYAVSTGHLDYAQCSGHALKHLI